MDFLFSILAQGVIEIGKCICRMYPKMKTVIGFRQDFDNLTKEIENLMVLKDNVKKQAEEALRDGYLPKPEVEEWFKEVENVEKQMSAMQSKVNSNDRMLCQSCPNCCFRSRIAAEMILMLQEIQRIMEVGQFSRGLVMENYQVKRVEHIPGPSMEGQSTAMKNLNNILKLLADDNVCMIGVWGMGGIGKTTLVKNLNNKLQTDPLMQHFNIVIWATVSKKLDLGVVQSQIASRLNMTIKAGESLERIAGQLYLSLAHKRFLLILDDVWEAIDLESLGIPQTKDHKGSKVVLTTRSFDVCRQMNTDADVKVSNLSEDESWLLFTHKAGEVASYTEIEPLAKAVTKECDGLPLAIIIAGSSMRGKTKIELWKDALRAFQRSVPHNKVIEDKVYRVVKWSYDAIKSKDAKMRARKISKNKQENRKGMDIETCFLYCSLYPEDFPIKIHDLVQSWLAEGLLDDLLTYEISFDRGITLVENLKDACLLEDGILEGTVKMHDVIRDVAIWIASSLEEEHTSIIQSGSNLIQFTDIKFSSSVKRISLMYNNIENLPLTVADCPHTSTLLLQGNLPLQNIPEEFLLAFRGLRVLNLSETGIQRLPPSVAQLTELRALILRQCHTLVELPPLGGLTRLQILDCSHTDIHKFPAGMENLTNLRQLDLSNTHSLRSIEPGMFSCLCSLEVLDMTNSAYKWGGSGTQNHIPFRELQRLNVLYVQVDKLDEIFDFSWVGKLQKFHFAQGDVDPRYEMSSTHDKRRITFSSLDLSSLRGKFLLGHGWISISRYANSCLLDHCTRLENLSSFWHKDNVLKSLGIVNSTWDFSSGRLEFDLFPYLEELTLDWIRYLDSITDICRAVKMAAYKLRVLRVSNCHRLKHLIYFDDFIQTLDCLEEVVISYCNNVEELFVNCSPADIRLPNLRIVKLNNLPKLRRFWQEEEPLQRLEQLEVIKSDLLRKLPLTAESGNYIKEIRGDSEWWNQLELDGEIKPRLQKHFNPFSPEELAAYH